MVPLTEWRYRTTSPERPLKYLWYSLSSFAAFLAVGHSCPSLSTPTIHTCDSSKGSVTTDGDGAWTGGQDPTEVANTNTPHRSRLLPVSNPTFYT